MEFDLSEAQRKRFDEVLAGVRAQSPDVRSEGQFAPFTCAQWAAAARLGMTGLCLPAEDGGGGLGALDTALCLEAFTEGGADTGLAFSVAAHLLACAVPVRDFGAGPVRGELLAGMANGALIAANAMTEDEAGSDIGTLRTTVVRDGDDYVVNGAKSYASNAPVADVLVVYGTSDADSGFLGQTALAVPRNLPGVTVGEPFAKMGLHACPAGRVEFRECRVPARYRLGAEGQGSAIFQHSMAWERSCLPAVYLGQMRRQVDSCVAHAKQRRQFGRPIGAFQAVSHRIATMIQRLEAARLLLYRACWLLDQGRPDPAATAMAKLAVSDATVANSLDAVHVFGGSGYLAGAGVEAQLRDSVPSVIFSGTSDIQREIIVNRAGL
ncbi:acyl-CoA dehydrogenase family protein [Amorphoplanes nipponensis]|uniref:Acyl-CoA dehydrogenase n=1 Tax=Actinoplanes nipponensis TaxID=135950 RepID=A0A919JJ62_9ACTN|nr:acyl-CoA dehydrogenase family protein [Actinoplanes nipponensis]GIE51718.1 acyl-CoA dehydrogenase [Actinoplanes nipponensis]